MSSSVDSQELERLRLQLAEAQATLEAIRSGKVDAVLVDLGDSSEVFTLQSMDMPYREFVERMVQGALSLDVLGKILYCNDAGAALLGRERERLLGQSFTDFLGPNARVAFELAANNSEVGELAASFRRPDGELIPVALTISPPGVHSHRRTNIVVSDLRISRHLAQVTEARDAAETASVAKDRFLAVLGHELRNPLAALTAAVGLLQDEDTDLQQRSWTYASMDRQLGQLRSLVDDLLDVARIAQSKIVLRKQRIGLQTLLETAIEGVRATADERGQSITVEALPAELEVVADPTRLEQILTNLLSNAVKYTDEGGSIRVVSRVDEDGFEISVHDTGRGLAPEDIETIFEPFAQVGFDMAGGLGIGLTLVRQLAELHGGTVHARSEGLGQGTEFSVRMPHASDIKPEETPRPRRSLAGLRVLIVDDNADAAVMTGMLLESRGMQTQILHLGAGVREVVERWRPDVLLLDIGLPDVSGYEVARELRAAGIDWLRIVAVTGYSHEEARTKIREVGIDRHIVKPLTLEGVLETLSQL